MIAVRPDWCISRQRVWGVPIIVFYCEGCREPVTDRKILDGVVELFAEHTADVWYERIGRRTAARRAHLRQVRRQRVLQGNRHSRRLVRFRIEPPGGAQRRASDCRGRPTSTWKAATSTAAGSTVRCWWARGCKGGAPYRACVLNGWVLDGEGKAMHKSLGNSIEPESVIKDHGAEILRLWTASVEFNEDVRMSPTILTRLVDAYRKLRNTFRYMLGNLVGLRPRDGRGAGRRDARRSTSGSCCAPKTWWRAAAPGTTTSSSTRSITRSTPSARWT